MDLQQILVYLTPFLILLATWIFNKIQPLVPGWLTVTLVTVLSAALTWIMQFATTPDLQWYWQFILGMVSIVLYQVIKQFSPSKIASDKAFIKEAKEDVKK